MGHCRNLAADGLQSIQAAQASEAYDKVDELKSRLVQQRARFRFYGAMVSTRCGHGIRSVRMLAAVCFLGIVT
jgi:hypothetical protein